MGALAMPLMAGGTLLQAGGLWQAGTQAQKAAEYKAGQLETQAGQSLAMSQRAAEEERRRARLVESRAMALAASGGGGTTDPTIARLISDIAGEGAYRAATAQYGGESQAWGLRNQAEAERYQGRVAKKAYRLQALSSLLQGGGSALYAKYGGGGPQYATETEW